MPRIKNWAKAGDTIYIHRPDQRFTLHLWNDKSNLFDKRHSNWIGEVRFAGQRIERIVEGKPTEAEARSKAVTWMRDNPEMEPPVTDHGPEGGCVECGGETPGPNPICNGCLDAARNGGHGRGRLP
jgi:hypothetical protein